jgi:hypothetical protein
MQKHLYIKIYRHNYVLKLLFETVSDMMEFNKE